MGLRSEQLSIEQPGSRVLLSPDYIPSENEAYMNPRQLDFFRSKLNDHSPHASAYRQ
jgi:hypothetical protein